jgi:hypothetical protein
MYQIYYISKRKPSKLQNDATGGKYVLHTLHSFVAVRWGVAGLLTWHGDDNPPYSEASRQIHDLANSDLLLGTTSGRQKCDN